MLDFRRTIVSSQKYAQVVRIDLAVRVLVDQSEDRQNRIVKLAHKLLLEQLNAFKALNLPSHTQKPFKLV